MTTLFHNALFNMTRIPRLPSDCVMHVLLHDALVGTFHTSPMNVRSPAQSPIAGGFMYLLLR
jgi:hypothetical protein